MKDQPTEQVFVGYFWEDPDLALPWITATDAEALVDDGTTFALSRPCNGFPVNEIDWEL